MNSNIQSENQRLKEENETLRHNKEAEDFYKSIKQSNIPPPHF